MRKELIIHTIYLVFFLVLIVVVKGWFDLSYWPLLVGGLIGTFLPDIDHLIYIYFLAPQELTSQRVNYMVSGGRNVWGALELLYSTREERKGLILHTFYFQIIFVVLTFFTITSSASVFGRGVVLAFLLHLAVDQLIDFMKLGGISTWFSQNLILDKEKSLFYWLGNVVVLLIFGLLM